MKDLKEITVIILNIGGKVVAVNHTADLKEFESAAFQLDGLLIIGTPNFHGFDHVSVSRPKRVPNYAEMKRVKRIFFGPDEWAMELHAPPSRHINVNSNVLHLWRPTEMELPIPPEWLV